MNKKKIKIIYLFALLFLYITCINSKEYKNNDIGLKFNYSDKIILLENNSTSIEEWNILRKKLNGKYVLFINYEQIIDSELFLRRYPGPDVTEQKLLDILNSGKKEVFNSTGIKENVTH